MTKKNSQVLLLAIALLSTSLIAREGDGAKAQYPDEVDPVRPNAHCYPVKNFGLRNFSDYTDSRGKRCWDVTNVSNDRLSLESDRQKIKINPDKTKELCRYNDYTIDAKNERGNAISIITDEHAVSIGQEANGCLATQPEV